MKDLTEIHPSIEHLAIHDVIERGEEVLSGLVDLDEDAAVYAEYEGPRTAAESVAVATRHGDVRAHFDLALRLREHICDLDALLLLLLREVVDEVDRIGEEHERWATKRAQQWEASS